MVMDDKEHRHFSSSILAQRLHQASFEYNEDEMEWNGISQGKGKEML